MSPIYLASKSPQRAQLLQQMGVDFVQLDIETDEALKARESAIDYSKRVACAKARAGWQLSETLLALPVIGADTCVVCNERILTKPVDQADARGMLQLLSGKTHQVITTVAMAVQAQLDYAISITDVSFAILTAEDIQAYLATNESVGRAGAYAIQGIAGQFVTSISGSYTGVVGLPLYETRQLLMTL